MHLWKTKEWGHMSTTIIITIPKSSIEFQKLQLPHVIHKSVLAAHISEISCVGLVTILKNTARVYHYLLPQKKQLTNLPLKYCQSHKGGQAPMYFQSIIRTNCITKYSI